MLRSRASQHVSASSAEQLIKSAGLSTSRSASNALNSTAIKAGFSGNRLLSRFSGFNSSANSLSNQQTRSFSSSSRNNSQSSASTATPSSGYFNRWGGVAIVTTSILLAGSYITYSKSMSPISSDSPFSTSAPFGLPRSSAQQNKQPITMMTPLQVSARIRELEESYFVNRGNGVVRYDVSQLPSNSPIEDDRSEKIVQVPLLTSDSTTNEHSPNSSDWMFWGVYDGHSGWTTSAKLRDSLIEYVLAELDKAYVKSTSDSVYRLVPSAETIDSAIRNGFLNLDNEIVHKSIERLLANPDKAGAAEHIAPALSGSCGLLAFYDTHSKDLRVAVTGDSRAVLGSMNDNGEWTARALSVDQTGSNKEEAARLRKEHPGEESTVVRRGRVLGSLEPTRAFGDARYKWTRDIQEKIVRYFFGRRVPQDFNSPPYVTAKPEITTCSINPKNGDFLVLGTDGLYEMLTNEEIVGLVAQWLNVKKPEYYNNVAETMKERAAGKSFWGRLFGNKSTPAHDSTASIPAKSGPGALIKADHSDLAITVKDISPHPESQKQVIGRQPGATPRFTVEDENIATHLIRNALGGADIQQVSMLVSIPSPISRSYRDDLTVTVVLFGDQGQNDSGSIRVNEDGTRKNLKSQIKAKV